MRDWPKIQFDLRSQPRVVRRHSSDDARTEVQFRAE
jgi:hypothetical protein